MTAALAPVPVTHRVADLRARVAAWRKDGLRVALVPTMGALHQGHLALVRRALELADRVVVSVFVNPIQFGPNEDFDAYPRTLDADRALLATVGASLAFAPSVAEMYPEGFSTAVTVSGVSEGLCGGSRPGHFSGVATVVTKLLLQTLPDVACFGEKDYQQVQVIRRFVRDLDIPVEIVGVPTVREADGLARSSRNAYLTPEERAAAPNLHRTLQDTAAAIRTGSAVDAALEAGKRALLAAGFAAVDYLELRAAEGLAPLAALDRPARLLVAARLGKTRLIDNIPVEGA
ncbi:pantothenate synthetase [uncultured Alphaproteobacteria bacterium]|uniref:Pantothenate synthetase n=1 Tax=uncultured Alphaproteobacteria bacterium TaxID=91750 RepID=A0A212KKZ7_9PROT|nr:pantothenate synthetase [uncultured Alphaproteobacteria bacterium]